MFVDENEIVNENEAEAGAPEEVTPEAVEPAEDAELETDLELDENGDIIIPEDDAEEGEEPETAEDGEEDASDEEDAQDEPEEDAEDVDTETEVVEPAEEVKEDPRDRELAQLRRELENLRGHTKDALEKLGVKDGDIIAGLVKLAAEASDKTPEEYLKEKAERDRAAEAMRLLQTTEFNKKAAADLREVQAAYPETKKYASIRDIPNFKRFGELRDAGLSPKEAYIAANPDAARDAVAAATKRQSLNNTKNHLRTAVPKGSKDNSVRMPRSVLLEWREMIPGRSDKELAQLYKEAIT